MTDLIALIQCIWILGMEEFNRRTPQQGINGGKWNFATGGATKPQLKQRRPKPMYLKQNIEEQLMQL